VTEPADHSRPGINGGERQVATQLLGTPTIEHGFEYLGSRLEERDIIDQLKVGCSEHFDAKFHGPPRVSSDEELNQ
jgi:hypothetical protein